MNGKKIALSSLFWPILSLITFNSSLLKSSSSSLENSSASAIVHATTAMTGTFQEALETLALQGHIALVAEGTPLRSVLPLSQAPDLSTGIPLEEAVEKVAKAYGYTSRRYDNVFELQKRYDDPRDLPPVTLEECRLAFRDVVSLCEPFNPHFPHSSDGYLSPIISEIGNSLTREQYQELLTTGLSFSTLSYYQQQLLSSFALYSYVQEPAQDAENISYDLTAASKSFLLLKGQGNRKALGWQSSSTTFRPLLIDTPLLVASIDSRAVPVDTTQESKSSVNLGILVASLSKKGSQTAINAAIATKPVTVAGISTVPVSSALHAIADVYGLRLYLRGDSTVCLERPAYPIISTVIDLPTAIRSVLPLPLLRAIHDDSFATPTLIGGAAPPVGTQAFALWVKDMQQWQDAGLGYAQTASQHALLPQSLCWEAMCRLTASVDKHHQNGLQPLGIPVASLPEADQEALAVAMTFNFLGVLNNLMTSTPPSYIVNLDQDCITGELNSNGASRKFTLDLEYRDHLAGTVTGTSASADLGL